MIHPNLNKGKRTADWSANQRVQTEEGRGILHGDSDLFKMGKILGIHNLKKRFILANRFWGFSQWLAGSEAETSPQ